MEPEALKGVVRYHEATKHHLHRYARSLGYMDWENQPNPYRSYAGGKTVKLPLLKNDPATDYAGLYSRVHASPKPFEIEKLAAFLELSLGLSAWKAAGGSHWALRMNPSSGNLHPTEAHLILPEADKLEGGVFHYNPFFHCLEQRAYIPRLLWDRIADHFQTEGFLVGLSSIFWRESWKYGERAFRYCNHDVGHALAALVFSARLQGWTIRYLNGLSDRQLQTVLGFDKTSWPQFETEHPDLLCYVFKGSHGDVPRDLPAEIVAAFAEIPFLGQPNQLSRGHVDWPIIDQIAALTEKPETTAVKYDFDERPFCKQADSARTAAEIIRQRRSAVAFNSSGMLTQNQFIDMLDKTLPRNRVAPFDAELSDACVDLLLFVHNVKGLRPGLYFFLRRAQAVDELKSLCRTDFLWEEIEPGFPLFLLRPGNFRPDARKISCHQEIAGDSVFSMGMIARFKETIRNHACCYRRLFWETGMIGQVLYLQAEAHDARGTGIGCFFDDAVHDLLGLATNSYQSLYHFTVGKAIEDERMISYPPYHHLKRSQM